MNTSANRLAGKRITRTVMNNNRLLRKGPMFLLHFLLIVHRPSQSREFNRVADDRIEVQILIFEKQSYIG
jgi:hypothetical protein